MKQRINNWALRLIVSVLGTSVSSIYAQTAVTTTNGGVTGAIPIFTRSSAIASSLITQSGNFKGVDTSTPTGFLDVAGLPQQGGFVVTGTNIDPRTNYPLNVLANSGKLREGWNRSGEGGEIDLISNRSLGGVGGFMFYDYTNAGTLTPLVTFTGAGNVGIGTATPGADLSSLPSAPAGSKPIFEVNGDIALSQGNGGQMFYPDGTVQATAWNGTTLGGDYAEAVDVLGDRGEYEPGDVIVIDSHSPGKFVKSSKPYSKLVAGVFSTKPGLVG